MLESHRVVTEVYASTGLKDLRGMSMTISGGAEGVAVPRQEWVCVKRMSTGRVAGDSGAEGGR